MPRDVRALALEYLFWHFVSVLLTITNGKQKALVYHFYSKKEIPLISILQ